MDWAKHRCQKAAAKLYLTLNMQTFLPTIAVLEEASHHDATRARELCVLPKEGEIVVFDTAYVDFKHVRELNARGLLGGIRANDNMSYTVVEELADDGQRQLHLPANDNYTYRLISR